MSDFKNDFYKKYVTTHISERKGDPTLDEFKIRSRIYDKHFGKFLPEDKEAQILDIGCGNGSIVWWLQQLGYPDSSGIDISEEQIKSGRRLGINNLAKGNLFEFLRNRTKDFQVIIARDVIEHLQKQEIVELLAMGHSALNSGGKLLLQVPNGESPFFGRIRYGDFTHEGAFSQSSLQQLLQMSGFDKVECYSSGPVVFGIRSMLRVAAWKVFEAFFRLALYAELGRAKSARIVTQNIIVVATKA